MKNKSHAYRNGGRLNVRVFFVVTSMFVLVYLLPHYAQKYDNSYINEVYLQEKIQIAAVDAKKAALSLECKNKGAHVENDTCAYSKAEIEARIVKFFPKSNKTMVAIAKAESGLNINAKNWNCFYNEDKSIVYRTRVKGSHSTSCKKEHRSFSYSVDCNVLQRNVQGQVCPKQTLDEHLADVAKLSKVQGLQAWSVFNNGLHERHLAEK